MGLCTGIVYLYSDEGPTSETSIPHGVERSPEGSECPRQATFTRASGWKIKLKQPERMEVADDIMSNLSIRSLSDSNHRQVKSYQLGTTGQLPARTESSTKFTFNTSVCNSLAKRQAGVSYFQYLASGRSKTQEITRPKTMPGKNTPTTQLEHRKAKSCHQLQRKVSFSENNSKHSSQRTPLLSSTCSESLLLTLDDYLHVRRARIHKDNVGNSNISEREMNQKTQNEEGLTIDGVDMKNSKSFPPFSPILLLKKETPRTYKIQINNMETTEVIGQSKSRGFNNPWC